MFSLAISSQPTPTNVISVGRTAFAPLYFMKRCGRPLRFVQKVKGEGYRFVPFLDSWPGARPS